ncbi:hypothetical protein Vadar_018892 [Vaccinium darrowii]|uniref:Uncharacterized protein n=1 Tax=Vaccinium darrowii TaxID=229202 RepID=A0ACB7XAR0_9ERIC|nr:hypothetical protein Vadar_018892 [Vaccinium darrowii]
MQFQFIYKEELMLQVFISLQHADNIKDRMPVILGDKESMDTWLFGSSSSKFETILKPYEGPDLVWYPVTSAMGKPSFDGPECFMEV